MEIPPDLQKSVPGMAGSLTALLFIPGDNWRRGVGMCFAGVFLAKVLGPSVAQIMHSSAEVAGYVTGLFGMAVVAKIFDMIAGFNATKAANDVWSAALKRLKG